MRLIAIGMIIAGLYFAVAKPWFSTNISGQDLASVQVYDRGNSGGNTGGWAVDNVFLEKENSPAIVRIKASRLPGKFQSNAKLKLLVRLAPISLDGSTKPFVINETVTVNLDTGNSGNSPQQSAEISVISTKEFEVPSTGNYKLGTFPIASDSAIKGSSKLQIDRNITQISATVMSGVAPVALSGTIMGAALIIVGILLMSMFNRRRRHAPVPGSDIPAPDATIEAQSMETQVNTQPEPEIKSKPETDVGKTIQWGRDAGKKR